MIVHGRMKEAQMKRGVGMFTQRDWGEEIVMTPSEGISSVVRVGAEIAEEDDSGQVEW